MIKNESPKRSIIDKFICGYKAFGYSLIEPVKLFFARLKYDKIYIEKDRSPLISVYTPTYNRGNIFIQRALPSVLAQTYKNFEYIVVGDCCADNTAELMAQCKDQRVRFYNLPERGYRYPPTVENHWLAGPVIAANQALSLVKGKWIARIDDDDIWTPDHLELLLRFAQQGNYEFVSACLMEERFGERKAVNTKNEIPPIGGTQTWLYRSYLKNFKYNINCWRKSWNRVNDTDLQDRFYKAGVRLGFLEKVVTYVFPRPGEKTIGLSAYKLTAAEKLKHFEFKK